ncbi:MAG: glycosyltransferase family 2 protein [Rubrivivax sp.]
MVALVSVVIPVYNCEAYVAEAVQSVLAQDHPRIEILAIDDGSKDGSVAALRRFGDALRVIEVPNGGPARARNLGMDEARGDYIAFLDADDIWLPGKISAQVAHMEAHAGVGACYTGWHVWAADDDGRFVRPDFANRPITTRERVPERSGWIYGRLLFDCELLTTTVMLRASVAHRVGRFEPELPLGEDYDFWLRMSQAAEISRLDCVGALYRVLPGSASRKARLRNYEHEVVSAVVARYGLGSPGGEPVSASALRQRLDRLVFQHGYQHLQQGDPGVAMAAFAQLLGRQPWRPTLWLNLGRAAWRRAGLG